MKHRFTLLVLVMVALTATPFAQEKLDKDVEWKIRREATDNSQIMHTMHFLTDVYGPRLTGSPNLKAAQDWIVKETTRWGLKNAHLEPWSFGHPGWVNERLSVHAIAPFKDALVVEALAWTPGTNGAVSAQVLQITVPSQPTKDVLTKFFDDNRAKVKGKIVMVGAPAVVPVTILTPQKRREDNDVRAQYDPVNPQQQNFGGGGGPQGPAEPEHRSRRSGCRAARSIPRFGRRGRPHQRRRPRARPDSRLQQPHIRRGASSADRRDA
jgi:hypothetical protein